MSSKLVVTALMYVWVIPAYTQDFQVIEYKNKEDYAQHYPEVL